MQFSQALITGATSGIGEAIAHLLHTKGIPLILSGRDKTRLSAVSRSIGGAICIAADLTIRGDRQRLVQCMRDAVPDLIVNCAGFGLYGPALDYEVADQLAILKVNAMAVAELTLEAATALKQKARSGVILNVSSAAAMVPMPYAALYGASKAMVNALSRNLDLEWRGEGIRVLAACPGMVATRFRERASKGKSANPKKGVMTAEFAAHQIWDQIQAVRPRHVFNWRYRLALQAARLLPDAFVGMLVRDSLNKRRSRP